MKKKLTKQQKQTIRLFRKLEVFLFAAILVVCALIGLLLPLRPKLSKTEKRTLTAFPKPSIHSIVDGSFFSDVSLWYSDTYPGRDKLIAADKNMKRLYGFTPSTQMIGGGEKMDAIPDMPLTTEANAIDSSASSTDAVASAQTDTKKEPKLPDSNQMEAEIQKQIQDGVYIENGAAYSMYYFNQDAANTYIQALDHAAASLNGTGNVYSILVPNQSGVMLPEETRKKLGGSDQKQAIDYYYASYNNVKSVDTIDTLREHNNEYLYFRTDHHWTQLAAYYTYQNFCQVKGITPEKLEDFKTTQTFGPFLGTFYSSFGNEDMKNNPDAIVTYYPNDTNDMKFWDKNDTEYDWHVITDVNGWDTSALYTCFIGGDNPLSIIENPNVQDGSSCLVLKESYGNCFVPFLVDHYQTVYVVDFRYAKQNVLQLMQEKNIQDLIVINNITIIGSTDVADTISGLLQ